MGASLTRSLVHGRDMHDPFGAAWLLSPAPLLRYTMAIALWRRTRSHRYTSLADPFISRFFFLAIMCVVVGGLGAARLQRSSPRFRWNTFFSPQYSLHLMAGLLRWAYLSPSRVTSYLTTRATRGAVLRRLTTSLTLGHDDGRVARPRHASGGITSASGREALSASARHGLVVGWPLLGRMSASIAHGWELDNPFWAHQLLSQEKLSAARGGSASSKTNIHRMSDIFKLSLPRARCDTQDTDRHDEIIRDTSFFSNRYFSSMASR